MQLESNDVVKQGLAPCLPMCVLSTPLVLHNSFEKHLAVSRATPEHKVYQKQNRHLLQAVECRKKSGKALQLHLVRSLGESCEV